MYRGRPRTGRLSRGGTSPGRKHVKGKGRRGAAPTAAEEKDAGLERERDYADVWPAGGGGAGCAAALGSTGPGGGGGYIIGA